MSNARRRSLAAAILWGMVFLAMIFALNGTLLNSMISHYSLTDSSQGLASSAASIGGAIALITSFFLIGKLKKTTLLWLALAVCALFLSLLPTAKEFSVFIVLWVFLGIGMGYVDMLLSSCMADIYHGKEGTRMMCVLHTSYGVSSMIVPILVAAALSNGLFWNKVYFLAAAFGVLLLLYFFIILRMNTNVPSPVVYEEKMTASQIVYKLTHGILPWLILAEFFQGFFLIGLNTWINRYVGVTLGSSLGDTALSFLFFGVMASRLIMSFVSWKPESFVRKACFVSGLVFLAAIPFHNGIIMCIATALCGLCFGAMIPCMLNIGCNATPESTMLATTSMMLALYAGQSIVSPIIGALEASFNLDVGMILCGIAMFLTGLCCVIGTNRSASAASAKKEDA